MKEYYVVTDKKNELNIRDIYEIENNRANRLFLEEKTIDFKILHSLNKFSRRDSIEILEDENLLTAIYERDEIYKDYKSLKKYYKIIKLTNKPGEYYPRIFRPLINKEKSFLSQEKLEKTIILISGKYDTSIPRDEEIMIGSINQLAVLTDELNQIFKTIHPTKNNYKTFGHSLRNLLILACTEVEAQLKGVIRRNSTTLKANYTTKDYYKLKEILKLNEYKISFNYYPSINFSSPFKYWKQDKPTQSLKWYDNYNAVKHDREESFDKASLINTIDAISALVILITAQYGNNISYWNERMGNYYNIKSLPTWKPIDYYLPPFDGSDWTVKQVSI